jgi:cyanate permease
MIGAVLVGAAVAAFFLVRLKGRAEGWRVALGVLSAFALFSVAS